MFGKNRSSCIGVNDQPECQSEEEEATEATVKTTTQTNYKSSPRTQQDEDSTENEGNK